MSPLGRGLGSLIPSRVNKITGKNQEEASGLEIPVNKISVNPEQPRQFIDHKQLENLIQSVKDHGILQPVLVTKTLEGYELVAGERRFRAAQIAGLKTIPAVVRTASELEKLELALIENIQRADLNPMEKAEAYNKLMKEFRLSQEEAARRVGISRPAFSNTLRFLSLSSEIQKALADGKISEGHAKVILSLKSPQDQMNFFHDALENNFSVRTLERKVRELKPRKKISVNDPQIRYWEDQLRERLKTKVNIAKKGEKGKVMIDFYSQEELSNIINNIIS